MPKVITYFTEIVPRFTTNNFQYTSLPFEQLALEVHVVIML